MIRLPHTQKNLSTEYKSLDILNSDSESFRYGYMWKGGKLKFAPYCGESVYSFGSKSLVYKKYIPESGRLFYTLSGGASYALDIDSLERALFGYLTAGMTYAFATYTSEGDLNYGMAGKTKCYMYESDFTGKQSVTFSYSVFGGIIHCFRLFCIDADDPLIVRWSGPEYIDWTEGVYGSGYIRLNSEGGKILALAEYGDDILMLREGGITVLRALGDPRNYRISPAQLLIGAQNIVGSGGVYNDKYYFLCSDGIYSFDGDEVERVFTYPYGDITYNSIDVPSDGRVYVGCTVGENDYILAFRPDDKSFTLFGMDCSDPFYTAEGMFVVCGNAICGLDSSLHDENSVWRSKTYNLGTGSKKTLKKIHVSASSEDVVTAVYADGVKRTFTGSGTFYVGERASEFYFELSSGDDISALSADFEVTK